MRTGGQAGRRDSVWTPQHPAGFWESTLIRGNPWVQILMPSPAAVKHCPAPGPSEPRFLMWKWGDISCPLGGGNIDGHSVIPSVTTD